MKNNISEFDAIRNITENAAVVTNPKAPLGFLGTIADRIAGFRGPRTQANTPVLNAKQPGVVNPTTTTNPLQATLSTTSPTTASSATASPATASPATASPATATASKAVSRAAKPVFSTPALGYQNLNAVDLARSVRPLSAPTTARIASIAGTKGMEVPLTTNPSQFSQFRAPDVGGWDAPGSLGSQSPPVSATQTVPYRITGVKGPVPTAYDLAGRMEMPAGKAPIYDPGGWHGPDSLGGPANLPPRSELSTARTVMRTRTPGVFDPAWSGPGNLGSSVESTGMRIMNGKNFTLDPKSNLNIDFEPLKALRNYSSVTTNTPNALSASKTVQNMVASQPAIPNATVEFQAGQQFGTVKASDLPTTSSAPSAQNIVRTRYVRGSTPGTAPAPASPAAAPAPASPAAAPAPASPAASSPTSSSAAQAGRSTSSSLEMPSQAELEAEFTRLSKEGRVNPGSRTFISGQNAAAAPTSGFNWAKFGKGALKFGVGTGVGVGADILTSYGIDKAAEALGVSEKTRGSLPYTATRDIVSGTVGGGVGAAVVGGGIAGGAAAGGVGATIPIAWQVGREVQKLGRGDESTWSTQDRSAYGETDEKGFFGLVGGALGLDNAGFRARQTARETARYEAGGTAVRQAANERLGKAYAAERAASEAAGKLSDSDAASFEKEAKDRGIEYVLKNYGFKYAGNDAAGNPIKQADPLVHQWAEDWKKRNPFAGTHEPYNFPETAPTAPPTPLNNQGLEGTSTLNVGNALRGLRGVPTNPQSEQAAAPATAPAAPQSQQAAAPATAPAAPQSQQAAAPAKPQSEQDTIKGIVSGGNSSQQANLNTQPSQQAATPLVAAQQNSNVSAPSTGVPSNPPPSQTTMTGGSPSISADGIPMVMQRASRKGTLQMVREDYYNTLKQKLNEMTERQEEIQTRLGKEAARRGGLQGPVNWSGMDPNVPKDKIVASIKSSGGGEGKGGLQGLTPETTAPPTERDQSADIFIRKAVMDLMGKGIKDEMTVGRAQELARQMLDQHLQNPSLHRQFLPAEGETLPPKNTGGYEALAERLKALKKK